MRFQHLADARWLRVVSSAVDDNARLLFTQLVETLRRNQGSQHLADVVPTSSGCWAAAGCCTCSRITASCAPEGQWQMHPTMERERPVGLLPYPCRVAGTDGNRPPVPGTVVGSWGVPMRPDHGSGRGIRLGAASPGREKVDRRGDTQSPHAHCMWHSCSIGLHRFLACCGVLMCCRFSFLFGRLPLFGWSGLCAGVATLVTCPSHAPSHTTQGSPAHLLSSGGPSFTS